MSCSVYKEFRKKARFADIVASVEHCNLCPRLCGRTKVLSSANGNVHSQVLFVAEAPGRLGADRTGVPLHGDRTGDNFEALLGNVGWLREEVFITNAILCNPRDEDGNNGTPTGQEIANCSAYLEMVIALVKPDVIATLGVTALQALDKIAPHGLKLKDRVGQSFPWRDMKVFPLYHPAPRAAIHRSRAKQRSDFMRLAKIVHPSRGLRVRKTKRKASPSDAAKGTSQLQQVARALLELTRRITYFKLTKLLYFVDLIAVRRHGHTVASPIYLRQVDGPWPPELDRALEAMEGYEVKRYFNRRTPYVKIGPAPRSQVDLRPNVLSIVAEVVDRYGGLTNSRIKTAAYQSQPMRHILRCERKGADMRNKPVLYQDKTAQDLHSIDGNQVKTEN